MIAGASANSLPRARQILARLSRAADEQQVAHWLPASRTVITRAPPLVHCDKTITSVTCEHNYGVRNQDLESRVSVTTFESVDLRSSTNSQSSVFVSLVALLTCTKLDCSHRPRCHMMLESRCPAGLDDNIRRRDAKWIRRRTIAGECGPALVLFRLVLP